MDKYWESKTINFLIKHYIGSYEELAVQLNTITTDSIHTMKNMRDAEYKITDPALLGK